MGSANTISVTISVTILVTISVTISVAIPVTICVTLRIVEVLNVILANKCGVFKFYFSCMFIETQCFSYWFKVAFGVA